MGFLRSLIITAGVILVLIGLFWPIVRKLPLFRLPGDINIERDGVRICIPITSMLVLSVILTLILRFLKR